MYEPNLLEEIDNGKNIKALIFGQKQNISQSTPDIFIDQDTDISKFSNNYFMNKNKSYQIFSDNNFIPTKNNNNYNNKTNSYNKNNNYYNNNYNNSNDFDDSEIGFKKNKSKKNKKKGNNKNKSTRVEISNIDKNVKEQNMIELFKSFNLKEYKFFPDQNGIRNGYLDFDNEDDANNFVEIFNGNVFGNKEISLRKVFV